MFLTYNISAQALKNGIGLLIFETYTEAAAWLNANEAKICHEKTG